jgi:predicted PurR-regulated permease PerM
VDAAEKFASTASGALILIPILALFFLANGAYLANALIQIISTKDNVRAVQSFVDELHAMLQHYIRAKVILCGLSFFVYSAAMFALGFPHGLGLGVLGGILEFIPVAGWMISAAIFACVGALTHSHWIWMLAVVGLWRMVMDYWVAPRVMGRALEIHPLLEIFAVMVGGAIGGIVGVYLSLPIVAALGVVWRRFAQPIPPAEQASAVNS